jgi:hypothetical protein
MLEDWFYWLIGGLLAAAGAILALWSLFADRPRGRKRCPKCWYDMSGVAGDPPHTCPECGRLIRRAKKLYKTRRRWRWAVVAVVFLIAGAASALAPSLRGGGWAELAPTDLLLAVLPYCDDAHEPIAASWKFDAWDELVNRIKSGDRRKTNLSRRQWNRLIDICLRELASEQQNVMKDSGTIASADDLDPTFTYFLDAAIWTGAMTDLGRVSELSRVFPVFVDIFPQGEWPTDVPIYWRTSVEPTWGFASGYRVKITSVQATCEQTVIELPEHFYSLCAESDEFSGLEVAGLRKAGTYEFTFDCDIQFDADPMGLTDDGWSTYQNTVAKAEVILQGTVTDWLTPVREDAVDAALYDGLTEIELVFVTSTVEHLPYLYLRFSRDCEPLLRSMEVAADVEIRCDDVVVARGTSRLEMLSSQPPVDPIRGYLRLDCDPEDLRPRAPGAHRWELRLAGNAAEAFRYAQSGKYWDGEVVIPIDWTPILENAGYLRLD